MSNIFNGSEMHWLSWQVKFFSEITALKHRTNLNMWKLNSKKKKKMPALVKKWEIMLNLATFIWWNIFEFWGSLSKDGFFLCNCHNLHITSNNLRSNLILFVGTLWLLFRLSRNFGKYNINYVCTHLFWLIFLLFPN